MVSFYRGWPKTQYIGQTGFKLTAICLSAKNTGENHYIGFKKKFRCDTACIRGK